MARILSISYDETLLRTRELMLKGAAHRVKSALGFQDATESCSRDSFDVIIIGHSIPQKDKLAIIGCFREANPKAVVIALTRAGETRLNDVDHYINPGDPEELLRALAWILNPKRERRDGPRRVK